MFYRLRQLHNDLEVCVPTDSHLPFIIDYNVEKSDYETLK